MGNYVDFAAIKQVVTIEMAAEYLGLTLKKSSAQLRGSCPACKTGGDRTLALTPSKGLWYCFSGQVGGDCLQLVAHMRGMEVKEAAQELAQRFLKTSSDTIPP